MIDKSIYIKKPRQKNADVFGTKTKKKKRIMDFFPLISKSGTLWIVAGFGLVSIQLIIRIVLILYRISNKK